MEMAMTRLPFRSAAKPQERGYERHAYSRVLEVEAGEQSVTACRVMFYHSVQVQLISHTSLGHITTLCSLALSFSHGPVRLLSILSTNDPVHESSAVPDEFSETRCCASPYKDGIFGRMGSEYTVESDGTCKLGDREGSVWHKATASSGMCYSKGTLSK
jgi:hypothetical protein